MICKSVVFLIFKCLQRQLLIVKILRETKIKLHYLTCAQIARFETILIKKHLLILISALNFKFKNKKYYRKAIHLKTIHHNHHHHHHSGWQDQSEGYFFSDTTKCWLHIDLLTAFFFISLASRAFSPEGRMCDETWFRYIFFGALGRPDDLILNS